MSSSSSSPQGEVALLNQALKMLRRIGYECEGVEVSIATLDSGVRLVFRSTKVPRETIVTPDERPENVPHSWRWLSPLEESVVAAMRSSGGWVTAAQLARECGQNYGTDFRVVLANMVERGILESAQGKGYKLNLP